MDTNNNKSALTVSTVKGSVRGAAVSGRPWKMVQTKRNSSIKKKSVRTALTSLQTIIGWANQLEDRKQKEIVKRMEFELKEEKRLALEEKKKREEERKQRKLENEKRAEVYQLVSAAKAKRMKKKQFKNLKKVGSDVSGKLDTKKALAMKALFLSGLDRREEAHEVIKKAIKNDINNHVCWHAYGLIYRAEKNYEEVIKCYTHALRIDKENLGIFRDFASMQVQLRNLEAYLEASLQIILLRPSVKLFWLSVAAAFHLSKDFDGALQTMNIYNDMFLTNGERGMDYENSEIIMYHAMILEESGDLQSALDLLDSKEKTILDKKSLKETRARILLNLGQKKQAEIAYKILFKSNPDSYHALEGIQKSKNLVGDLNSTQANALFELFEDLIDQYRRSNTLKRVPLNFASGDRFGRMIDHFLRFNFQKGVPSLFMSLRALYSDHAKLAKIQDLCLYYVENLSSYSQFGEPVLSNEEADDEEDIRVVEPPSALLWVYYYLAQHFDFLGERAKALEYIELAISHTPTLVELFMTKARILKHAGDVLTASEVMNYARNLDLQDRCINSKSVKYMLRAGNIEEAEKTIILFCRVDAVEKLQDLMDMQCSWFAYESGMAYAARGDYGRALKKFHQIEKFFFDIYDDQFDFHTYSMRKATLRTYIDLIRIEDQLRAHPYYFRAAIEAVKLYIYLSDIRVVVDQKKDNNRDEMSEAERKKALRKARKAELKGSATETTDNASKATVAVSTVNSSSNGAAKKKDDDPDGIKLLNEADLLTESLKFLKPLLQLSPNRIESQVLGASVYLRRKNYLLAVKALKKGLQIDAGNPELHKLAVQLALQVESDGNINEHVRPIVLDGLKSIISHDLKTFNSTYANDYAKKSLLHSVAVAEVSAMVDSPSLVAAIDALISLSSRIFGYKVEDAIAAHKSLVKLNASQAQIQAFSAKCVAIFPLASYFKAQ
ncbi:N-alpha-acetyltransferase 15, NatA auxiliary subunit [Physocladia obscura]|uniref:N-alpha-acetyltransferase 15, NatA auxiliary subunit n=1 Tax=Physocladia obscura TaxID=109957 RepID=A0AAD5TAY3_9FUNG|nr:N-alpha-acetyltransferase 15, NatA auxiliary subunit [Physocladia obscura]